MENNQTFKSIAASLNQSFFKLIKDFSNLASLEAKLAGKSLVNIMMLSFIARVLLMATWLSFCLLVALYLVSLDYSWIFALTIITVTNFLGLILVASRILKLKKNISFTATRRQLHELGYLKKDSDHAQSPVTDPAVRG